MNVRKIIALFLAVSAIGWGPAPSPAADLQAKIIPLPHGRARVVFQPLSNSDQVHVYTREGRSLGTLENSPLFEFEVSEARLKQAMTAKGVNVHALLWDLRPISVDQKILVGAELPFDVVASDGQEIPSGTQVYFSINNLVGEAKRTRTTGNVGPVGAKDGAAEIVDSFNTTLEKQGVQGVPRPSKAPAPVPTVPRRQAETPAAAASSSVLPRTSLADAAALLLSGINGEAAYRERVLSPPTCKSSGNDYRVSPFGWRRQVPLAGGGFSSHHHAGIDVANQRAGDPIYATAAGCITQLIHSNSWGRTIYIDHGGGLKTQYSHMQAFAKGMAAPNRDGLICVKRGQVIGYVGSSGHTGSYSSAGHRRGFPHLHFGVIKDGKPVDPMKHLMFPKSEDMSMECGRLAEINREIETIIAARRMPNAPTGTRSASVTQAPAQVTE